MFQWLRQSILYDHYPLTNQEYVHVLLTTGGTPFVHLQWFSIQSFCKLVADWSFEVRGSLNTNYFL